MSFLTSRFTVYVAAAALILPFSSADTIKNGSITFQSRPDLIAPELQFLVHNRSAQSPGYTFIAPYAVPPSSAESENITIGLLELFLAEEVQNGPYIYDNDGETLIYSGFGVNGPEYATDLKVAEYNGAPHLTFWQGTSVTGTAGGGQGVILNNAYRPVSNVQVGLGRPAADGHEFTILPGGTAIINVNKVTQYDLSSLGVKQPIGWLFDNLFQEIDISSGEVLFEWSSLDHVDPSESYVTDYVTLSANTSVALGTSPTTGWDYFHLNSVQKLESGDYIISARNTGTVYSISGKDGSIIWRLNGKNSSFVLDGFTFAYQHHARILTQNASKTTLSLFDDGADGVIPSHTVENTSSGKIITINHITGVATLEQGYYPIFNLSSTSQGSMQVLEDKNVVVGWGAEPYISEYTQDGACIMFAKIGNMPYTNNYRVFKFDWEGNPISAPAIWMYAASNESSSKTEFFTSWNGATEVAEWRYYGVSGNASSALPQLIGTSPKKGFETVYTASSFYSQGFVEAYTASGVKLGTSVVSKTYLPAH